MFAVLLLLHPVLIHSKALITFTALVESVWRSFYCKLSADCKSEKNVVGRSALAKIWTKVWVSLFFSHNVHWRCLPKT